MIDKIDIEVTAGAFDKDVQRNELGMEKMPYDGTTAGLMRAVEPLDRYDDFSRLKIPPTQYRHVDGEYGITVIRGKNDSVIHLHQQDAALKFLKELRGFGLLADVVGSGKTFEACVVLSELAVRDKVRSLLLVVPEQVYSNWITVFEQYFGLGKGVLQPIGADFDLSEIDCETVNADRETFLRPTRPLIVKTEDFVQWTEDTKKLLFDVIVVDEAHHLCVEEGKYARAMKLLSLFMETKKKANSTYCILLSATPHSGNLENMFRLWYFIRCKGGNPSDFEEKEDKNRTAEYRKEKQYYKEHVCRGATTVMEFIKKVKLFEVTETYGAQLDEYLAQKKKGAEFERGTEGEKLLIIEDFLRINPDIKKAVTSAIANAYHNGVLRSIMIRQPNNLLAKKKYAINYFFFPMQAEPSLMQTKGLKGESITVDLADMSGKSAITVGTKTYSVREYVDDFRGDKTYAQAYAEFVVQGIVNVVGATEPIFQKPNSGQYYWTQMAEMPERVSSELVPFRFDGTDTFSHKLEFAKKLLRTHAGERVLVFFDYDVKAEKAVWDRFEEALLADKEFKKRVLVGNAEGKDATVKAFEEKKDAILIVKTSAFTEGVNLQQSNVILNFEVTPDPLSMDQRIGRIFRLGQQNDVTLYSFADMQELEGYVLAYFSRIGLMSSNNGDATIIAGSNNDRMVTVRCSVCGNVMLLSQEDYEKRKRDDNLYCIATPQCHEFNSKGTRMEEITVYNFRCDTCGSVFERSVTEEGYLCMSRNNDEKGIMCNSGEEGDRSLYCRKICAVAHCSLFQERKELLNCPALKLYRENPNVTDNDLMTACERCGNMSCPPRCRMGIGKDAVAGCGTCDYSTCRPKPHLIAFNEKWEACCPDCEQKGKYGKLSPVVARTFATYIRGAWNFRYDGGKGFCENLMKEASKVADIKTVLEMDGTEAKKK